MQPFVQSMRVVVWAGIGLLLAPGPAARANLILYQCGLDDPVVILDGDPGDADATDDRIEHDFECDVDGGLFAWHAEGTIVGLFDPPQSVTSSLSNLTIINTGGNVMAQLFRVEHMFQSPLGPPPPLHTAEIAGHFDNASGVVNGARLEYSAFVDGLGGDSATILHGLYPADGSAAGAAPIPFADADGPVSVDAAIRHRLQFLFYLDSPGDSIVLGGGEGFGAEAAPIPEPLMAGPLAVAALMLRRRWRSGRRRATPGTGPSL